MLTSHETFSPPLVSVREKLDELRTQLVDLAFALDRRGQAEAADVATITAARIGELCEELRIENSSGPARRTLRR